jgi:DNA-binding transcriptional LysR family regulator
MSQVPSLRDIEMFNLVATELSFRRAAERMAIDQSALSRRIRQLEEQLGFQLIRRTTREVSLTSAGEIFHEETRLIDTQISSAMETARIAAEGKRGRLRIGYMSFAATEIMPTIVREFIQLYPDIDLTLKYIRTQGQKIDLARNEIDAGFMLGPFWHQQFACQPISRELLMAVLPVNHRLAGRTSVTLAELSRYPLILGSMAEWDFSGAIWPMSSPGPGWRSKPAVTRCPMRWGSWAWSARDLASRSFRAASCAFSRAP